MSETTTSLSLESLLAHAIKISASDIHIDKDDDVTQVLVIDGGIF